MEVKVVERAPRVTQINDSDHWEKGFILNLGICIGKWMNI